MRNPELYRLRLLEYIEVDCPHILSLKDKEELKILKLKFNSIKGGNNET